ncbi:EpsG family protein [Klebsiella michiganensis]|uniref:EpsG family protein n=1 Tax=Klebsiella michiganensis TaxID=1134687 RepID=UPI0022467478|nr:EpsG family protein [Klebsiella michiganensis]EKV7895669.1 EpsG family protein [Klebsiella michiganensis]MCW9669562.1 EpsG family protein [Klebsiella michiganensis]HBM3155975.1 EpsG family protein [Klebsiella michiganensis]HDX9131171.1 EpsG family protein [Klebsiella michiganensis]
MLKQHSNYLGNSYLSSNKIIKLLFFYLIIIPALTFLVGVKDIRRWVDHQTYENYFYLATYNTYENIFKNGSDPIFVSLMKPFTSTVDGFSYFLILCAFITLSIKLTALKKSTDSFVILMILYSAYFLCLHDYIQIRISLAMAFVILGMYSSLTKKSEIAYFIIAALIHLTSVFVIIPYVIYKYFGRRYSIALILGAVFLPIILFSGIVHNARLETYIALAKYKDAHFDANPLASQPILQLIGLLYLYINKRLRNLVIHSYEYFISIIGVICFYGMLKVPVLSFRLFEMTMFFYIILLSRVAKKSFFIMILCLLFVLVGIKNMFYGDAALLALH